MDDVVKGDQLQWMSKARLRWMTRGVIIWRTLSCTSKIQTTLIWFSSIFARCHNITTQQLAMEAIPHGHSIPMVHAQTRVYV